MATALAKAQAMMAAHEVTEEELNLTKEEKAVLRQEPPGTPDEHLIKWNLLGSVAQFCGCRGWRRNRSRGGGIVFCGLPGEAQHATWLLDFLANFVKEEIVKYLMDAAPSNQDRRAAIRSFVLGCTERIGQRLYELSEQTEVVATSNAKALVVIKDQAIKTKMAELGIHLRSCSGSSAPSDDSSYRAGSTAGDRASFGRPVSGRSAVLRLK